MIDASCSKHECFMAIARLGFLLYAWYTRHIEVNATKIVGSRSLSMTGLHSIRINSQSFASVLAREPLCLFERRMAEVSV